MLYPMFVMILLTFVIGLISLQARFASVKSGQINPAYFILMRSSANEEVPDWVAVTTRAANNMFEVPVLFYAGAITAIALELETTLTIMTAWAFVVSRLWHSWIHLTYNNVLHRFKVYWLGLLLVLLLWCELVYLSL